MVPSTSNPNVLNNSPDISDVLFPPHDQNDADTVPSTSDFYQQENAVQSGGGTDYDIRVTNHDNHDLPTLRLVQK